MMMKIKVELGNLHSVSNKMQNVINSLSNIDAAMTSVTGSMGDIWDGPAKRQYESEGKDLRNAMNMFKDQVVDRKQSLENSLCVYERTEKTNVGKVSDLSANNIF